MRDAVHHLKYYNLKALSTNLAEFLRLYLQENPIPCDLLVPVPLHMKRLKQRGYNQSALLANALGKSMNLKVEENSLLRVKDSLPQARSANVEERRRNVYGAFSYGKQRCEGLIILLIDDVCTSGATLEACATALRAAGAASVWGLTVAREI
jgi:ComF family protein